MKGERKNGFKMVDVHDVRDINQTIFLHLIRERQPISRADIAKYTGLRAGTVSAIVNRLIKNNFVYEGTEGPRAAAARRSISSSTPRAFTFSPSTSAYLTPSSPSAILTVELSSKIPSRPRAIPKRFFTSSPTRSII